MEIALFSAAILALFAVGSSADDISACSNLTPHPTPTTGWSTGKELNLLFMSLANFAQMAEILTGGTKVDIMEEPCFKLTCDKNETNAVFTFHGYKAVADYECAKDKGATAPKACQATAKSTNLEWAKKLAFGKPVTIWSDDKTYAIDVRCPAGRERFWYVKSLHDVISPEEQALALAKVKALGLNIESAASFTNTKCANVLQQ